MEKEEDPIKKSKENLIKKLLELNYEKELIELAVLVKEGEESTINW